MTPRWLTVADIVRETGVSRATAWRMIAEVRRRDGDASVQRGRSTAGRRHLVVSAEAFRLRFTREATLAKIDTLETRVDELTQATQRQAERIASIYRVLRDVRRASNGRPA